MEVLGSLANLKSNNTLPIPWWHRAPLGLLHNTYVYIAIVKSKKRPVGDIILSVLNPFQWNNMFRIDCFDDDKPGIIRKVFEAILPLNIAIAETATVDSGTMHHVTLICEPFGNEKVDIETLKNKLKQLNLKDFQVRPFIEQKPEIPWHDYAPINYGWVESVEWKKELENLYPNSLSSVDLDRAVISADTTKRYIRYVFPIKGALSLTIEHSDTPGSLKEITQAIQNSDSNILSSLLRRGGAGPKNAILVAVCEPTKEMSISSHKAHLQENLKKLNQEIRPKWKISEGDNLKYLIYPKHPDDFVARVPSELIPHIKTYLKEIEPKKIPVFLSRRFLTSDRRDKIVSTVKSVLKNNGYHVVEANPEPGHFVTSIIQITSKMWLSKAGIVLVTGSAEQDGFGINLAHEAGFMQGQGKPVLILVEEESRETMKKFTNISGLVAPGFANDDNAFDPLQKNSIAAILTKWIQSMKSIE